jgi:hypothetical protein
MRFGKKTNKSKSKNEDIKSREEERKIIMAQMITPRCSTSSSSSATYGKIIAMDRLKESPENLDNQGKIVAPTPVEMLPRGRASNPL